MVKKAVVIWTIMMMLISIHRDFISQDPTLEPQLCGVEQETKAQESVAQGTISPYDPIFKVVCEEHGNDWRLMSAMAYHESRFRPDVESRQGAQGMMQIMPRTAEFFNVNREDLTNVETNIMVANLLVNRISNMLKLNNSIPEKDRMGLILASYNGGVGYVLNARKLARENGENQNSWSVVSSYLKQMKCPEFAKANNVRHFRGVAQTLAYVDNVIGHYDLYCQMAML